MAFATLRGWVYPALLAISIASTALFGIPHGGTWAGVLGSDALGYAQYAHELVTGGGYSMDGGAFDATREPGYPGVLAGIYLVFGTDNVKAIVVVQILLLSLTGYLAYLLARRVTKRAVAAVTGALICALPYYGYYAGEVMTEVPFAFALFLVLLTMVRLAEEPSSKSRALALGLSFALAALIRAQMLLFPLAFALVFLLLYRRDLARSLATVGIVLAVYLLPILAWSTVVYQQTGTFMITEGRQEMLIHVRAVRSSLSYSDQMQYAKEWIIRSTSGGARELPLVETYDLKPIKNVYREVATTPEAIRAIKHEDIQTILGNPGHYLFGNVVEVMKFLYIEHDYSDYLHKYLRLANYVVIYGLFALGLLGLALRYRRVGREGWVVAGATLLVVGYHLATLTALETVPRFNTPLHGLYVLVGALGLYYWWRPRARAHE